MSLKQLNTKVLSARVQPDVYTAWQRLAKSKNMSVSECLRDAVTMVDGNSILKKQDKIQKFCFHSAKFLFLNFLYF